MPRPLFTGTVTSEATGYEGKHYQPLLYQVKDGKAASPCLISAGGLEMVVKMTEKRELDKVNL